MGDSINPGTLHLLQSLAACTPVAAGGVSGSQSALLLDLHRRFVQLATLQHELEQQLRKLDDSKAALAEQKLMLQNRMVSALNARLQAAHATVDTHRTAVLDHMSAVTQLSRQFQQVLQGSAPGGVDTHSAGSLVGTHDRLMRVKIEAPVDLATSLSDVLLPHLGGGASTAAATATTTTTTTAGSGASFNSSNTTPAGTLAAAVAAHSPGAAMAALLDSSKDQLIATLQRNLEESQREAARLRGALEEKQRAEETLQQRLRLALQWQADQPGSRYRSAVDLLALRGAAASERLAVQQLVSDLASTDPAQHRAQQPQQHPHGGPSTRVLGSDHHPLRDQTLGVSTSSSSGPGPGGRTDSVFLDPVEMLRDALKLPSSTPLAAGAAVSALQQQQQQQQQQHHTAPPAGPSATGGMMPPPPPPHYHSQAPAHAAPVDAAALRELLVGSSSSGGDASLGSSLGGSGGGGSAATWGLRLKEAYRRALLDIQHRYQQDREAWMVEHRRVVSQREAEHGREVAQLRAQHQASLNLVVARLAEVAPSQAAAIQQALQQQRRLQSAAAAAAAAAAASGEPAAGSLGGLDGGYNPAAAATEQQLPHDGMGAAAAGGGSGMGIFGADIDGGIPVTRGQVHALVAEAVRGKEAQDRAELFRVQDGYARQLQELKAQYEHALCARDEQYSALLAELKALRANASATDSMSNSRSGASGGSSSSAGRRGGTHAAADAMQHSLTSMSHDRDGSSVLSLSADTRSPLSTVASNRSVSLSPYFTTQPGAGGTVRSSDVRRLANAVVGTSGMGARDAAAAADQAANAVAVASVAAHLITRRPVSLQASPQRPSPPAAAAATLFAGATLQNRALVSPPRRTASPGRQGRAAAAPPAGAGASDSGGPPAPSPTPLGSSGAATQPESPAEPTLICARCGLNDASSPGVCRFHPALVPTPGPLLYSPEWHACKAAGHRHGTRGCYVRKAHHYPEQTAAAAAAAAFAAATATAAAASPSPRPRSGRLPQPTAYVSPSPTRLMASRRQQAPAAAASPAGASSSPAAAAVGGAAAGARSG